MEKHEHNETTDAGLGAGAGEYAQLDAGRLPDGARTETRAYGEDPYQTAAVNADKAGYNDLAQLLREEAGRAGDAEVEKYDRGSQFFVNVVEAFARMETNARQGRRTSFDLDFRGTQGRPEFEERQARLHTVLGADTRHDVSESDHWDQADRVYDYPTQFGPTLQRREYNDEKGGVYVTYRAHEDAKTTEPETES